MNKKMHLCVVVLLLIVLCVGCGKDKEVDGDIAKQKTKKQETTQESTITEKATTQEKTPQEVTTEKATTEEITTEEPVNPLDKLQTKLEQYSSEQQAKGNQLAVCVMRMQDGSVAIANSHKMQSASVIKLYVAATVYEHYSDVLKQSSGEQELESQVGNMIKVSDNNATNELVKRLGKGNAQSGMALVNEYCAKYNYKDTHMGRLMLDFNASDDNYTSVSDCSKYYQNLLDGDITSGDKILGYLKQQERRGKIPAGIPSGVVTANKTGELTDVENDAAIIYAANGTYTICVMMENLKDPAGARSTITNLSSEVYQYMTNLK